MLAVRSDQRGSRAIVIEIDHDLCLGGGLHIAIQLAASASLPKLGIHLSTHFSRTKTHGHQQALRVSHHWSIRYPGIEFATRGAGTSGRRHEESVRLNPMRFWARVQA